MKRPVPAREVFAHSTDVQSVWGDMDALGHVNNVLYFRYAETARLDYMSELIDRVPGLKEQMWSEQGMILADIGCAFLKQLRAPARLQIGTRIARIGKKTLYFQQGFFLGDGENPVAVTDTVMVWFSYQQQSSIAVPESLRAAIREMETTPPEEE